MKLAIWQTAGVSGDPAGNLAALAATARRAADAGAGLLILPELWLSGYNIGTRVWDLAEPADGPAAARVGAIASEAGLAILYGYPERAGDAVYNAARLIGADGVPLANMRKAHLFGPEEKRLFAPGDTGLPVVDCAGLRLGIMICYDVEFPEAVRAQRLAGAELICVPTALMQPHSFVARQMIPVRAIENQVFVAYANRCGTEGGLVYVGESCLCAPDGGYLARAGAGEELILAEIDPGAYAETIAQDIPYIADRRPELYGPLAATPAAAATARRSE